MNRTWKGQAFTVAHADDGRLEGQGEHIPRKGNCVLQPPGIGHREVRHSDDLELIEITSPAGFATHAAKAPE